MSRPLFCPNCGASLPEGPHGAQPFHLADEDGSCDCGGWDCFCDNCQWSGDIMPDDEDELVPQEEAVNEPV